MTRERKASGQTLALLAVLLEQPNRWRHGYDLSEATGLKSGTLYPALVRLSERGLLDSKWSLPQGAGRPARHLYRLTTPGVSYAQAQMAQAAAITAPLGGLGSGI